MFWTDTVQKMYNYAINVVTARRSVLMLMMYINFPENPCGKCKWDWSNGSKPPLNHGYAITVANAQSNALERLILEKQ